MNPIGWILGHAVFAIAFLAVFVIIPLVIAPLMLKRMPKAVQRYVSIGAFVIGLGGAIWWWWSFRGQKSPLDFFLIFGFLIVYVVLLTGLTVEVVRVLTRIWRAAQRLRASNARPNP